MSITRLSALNEKEEKARYFIHFEKENMIFYFVFKES
jgi:hypothetical protein